MSKKPKKRIRFWLIVIILVVLLLIFLPWYLPNGIIKGQVISQLQSDFGREVSIGEVKIGWSSGVEIFDLVILRRDRFGEGSLCQVKRIHTDFAPLDLARSIIRKITFDEPHFFVVFDDEGINIADLPPLESEHTIVNGAVIHLVSRLGGSEQETAVFELDRAEIKVGTDEAKQTWWSVEGHQVVKAASGGEGEPRATFSSQGQLGIDPEGGLPGPVQYVNLDIDRLNLGEVKLVDLYRHWRESLGEEQKGLLPEVEQLTGVFSVDTQITIEESDRVKMNSLIELTDVEWSGGQQEAGGSGGNKIDNVLVEMAGNYTISSKKGELERLWVTGDGVGFELTGRMDEVTGSIDGFNLSMEEGWIDPGVLMAVAPDSALSKMLESNGFSSAGQITFDGYLNIDKDTVVNYINLDGSEWSFETKELVKRAGDPLSGKVEIRGDRETGDLEFRSIRFKGGELSGSGNIYATGMDHKPIVELRDYFDGLGGFLEQVRQDPYSVGFNFHFALTDFDAWASHYLPLSEVLPGLTVKGPVEADVRFEPGDRGQELLLHVKVPAATKGLWVQEDEGTKRVLWDKPEGTGLEFQFTGMINPEERMAEDLLVSFGLGSNSAIMGSGDLVWSEGFDWDLFDQIAGMLAVEDITGRLKLAPIERFEGEWQINGIDNWLAIFPDMAGQLANSGIELGGGALGQFGYEKQAGVRLEARGKVDFGGLDLQINAAMGKESPILEERGYFSKAVGMESELGFEVGEDLVSHKIDYRGVWTVENGGMFFEAQGRAERLSGAESELSFIRQREWDFELRGEELGAIGLFIPELLDERGRISVGDLRIGNLGGSAVWKSNLVAEDFCQHWHFELEGDEATFELHQVRAEPNDMEVESMVWDKPRGHRLGVSSDFDLARTYNVLNTFLRLFNKSPESSNVVTIKEFDLWAGNSRTSVNGKLLFENGEEDFWNTWRGACQEIDLDWQVNLNHDSPEREDCPDWFDISEQLQLAGQSNLWGTVKWKENSPEWKFDGVLDFSETGFDIASQEFDPEGVKMSLVKPIGDELKINYDFDYERDEQRLGINRWQVNFGDNLFLVRGAVTGIDETLWQESYEPPVAVKADLSVSLLAVDVAQLAGWLQPIDDYGLSGQLTALADFEIELGDNPSAAMRQFGINGAIEGTIGEKPVVLDIQQAVFTPWLWQIPAVRFMVGDNDLSVVAEVAKVEGGESVDGQAREGRIDIIGDHLDVDDLQQWLEQLLEEWRGNGMIPVKEEALGNGKLEVVSPNGLRTEPMETKEVGVRFPDFTSGASAAVLLEIPSWLSSIEIIGSVDLGELYYTDAKTTARVELQEFHNVFELAGGKLSNRFWSGLNGGVVAGEISSDLTESEPTVHYTQTALDIRADDKLSALVESEFPGMEVEGSFSDQKNQEADLSSLLAGSDIWRGTGSTVCRDGVLYGPGGPDWMMSVFPGLKLVEYRWREMNSQFELLADGSKKNNVLFNGEIYNIYLEGVTVPVSDEEKYAEAIGALEADLKESREQVTALEEGSLRLNEAKARRLRMQNEGLEGLWRDYKAGETLRIYEADYVIGGILGMRSGKLFEKPRELLRIPIFNSLSFISGQTMFGSKTTMRARR